MSVQVSYKKQFLFGIILLVLALIIVEGLVYVWWYQLNTCEFEKNEIFANLDDKTKRDICLESYELQFGDTRISNFEGKTIRINSEGFRGEEITRDKPPNTYRIIIVGGSTTFGGGVLGNETYPYYLEKKFEHSDFDFNVEVINAGIGGADSLTETKLIKNRLVNFDPDLFIVYDGWNDLSENIRDSPEFDETLWKERWNEICTIGIQSDFDVVVTLQPILGTGNKVLTVQENQIYMNAYDKLSRLLDSYPRYVLKLSELNENCSLTADLRNIFDSNSESIFYDVGHTGSLGNQIIAENMFDLISPIVQEKSALAVSLNSDGISMTQDKEFNYQPQISNPFFQKYETFAGDIISFYKTPRIIPHFLTTFTNQFSGFKIISDDDQEKNQLENSLSGVDFSRMDLSGVDFSDKELKNAIFYQANLTNANFVNSDVTGADFRFANLQGVNFEGLDLKGVKLSGADLTNAKLAKIKLINSNLNSANFLNADLRGADFSNSELSFVNFKHANLQGSHLNESTLTKVKFSKANLTEVNFRGADLFNVEYFSSILQGADFTGANITKTTFFNAELMGADFTETKMRKATFTNANLTEARFVSTYFVQGNLENADLTNANFTKARLEIIHMTRSNLYEADFTNAELVKVNLRGADLTGAELKGINLQDVDFTNAKLDRTNIQEKYHDDN